LFRADHMHNPLTGVVEIEQFEAMFRAVFLKLTNHPRNLGIGDAPSRAARWHVMIGNAKRQRWFGDPGAAFGKFAERMKRPFVYIVTIDPEQRLAVFASQNLVSAPKFIYDSLRLGHLHTTRLSRGRIV